MTVAQLLTSFMKDARLRFVETGNRCFKVVPPDLFLQFWDHFNSSNVSYEVGNTNPDVLKNLPTMPALYVQNVPLVIVSCGKACEE